VSELNGMLVIAYRDLLKFTRDRSRVVASLVFPFIFIGALGGSLQSSFGSSLGYDFVAYILTGVFAQTLFQSSAMGIMSLIEDRQNDFSQEIFVSPISRYSIVLGKIAGESLVALAQGGAILLFGLVLGLRFTGAELVALLPVALIICLFSGAFGVMMLANISSQRAANQIFPFIMLPQFFLAGIFNPIDQLPWYLDVLSRLSPLRYAVDLARGAYYIDRPEHARVVLASPLVNLAIMAGLFAVFLSFGTYLFVRNERNR
jgi:ABC-2 type transport system permease protein